MKMTPIIILKLRRTKPLRPIKKSGNYYDNILLSSRNFFKGGKIYCYANSFCYANFSIAFGPNFRGTKVSKGGQHPPLGRKLAFLWVINVVQVFGWLLSDVCFILHGRADIGPNESLSPISVLPSQINMIWSK